MSKKTLIETKLLDKIFSFFGGSGSTASKEKFFNTIKDTDPQVARAFTKWDSDLMALLQTSRKIYVKNGVDTKEVDRLINKLKG